MPGRPAILSESFAIWFHRRRMRERCSVERIAAVGTVADRRAIKKAKRSETTATRQLPSGEISGEIVQRIAHRIAMM